MSMGGFFIDGFYEINLVKIVNLKQLTVCHSVFKVRFNLYFTVMNT